MGAAFSGPVTFKYLKLGEVGGRGGVVRFFFLVHRITYKEELYTMGREWAAAKQWLIESGENPAGTVPVVQYGETTLTQHIAIMRYIAKQKAITSGVDGDHVQDAVADEYQAFRDAWAAAAFGGDEDMKATFKKVTVPEKMRLFDDLYRKLKRHDTYLSVTKAGRPLWGDCAVYGLVRDMLHTEMMEWSQLAHYPHIKAMYEAFGAQPAVADWVEARRTSNRASAKAVAAAMADER